MLYQGSCHCGRVRFEVTAPSEIEVEDCNCSICAKSGYLHLILPLSRFRLQAGQADLIEYNFNSGLAKHWFCRVCGVKAFYQPRSNPDGMDVNVNCLDDRPEKMTVVPFDGRNWEANAHKLAHKSQEA